jgi:2-dehydro-3-deoxyphosphooctonate aldolase (KDO 8-P synthase)
VPGGAGEATGGDRRFVAPLARAAVAVGIDALFVECHPDPDRAPCDGASQIDLESLDRLLYEVCAVQDALDRVLGGGPGGRA